MGRILKVTCSPKSGIALFLAADRLKVADGAASILVAPGEYPLIWVVSGEVGSAYSVTVISPSETAFHVSAVLGESGRDAGVRWVTL